MSPEDEKYFDSLLNMFMTPGWKVFIEETAASVDTLDSVIGLDDAKALHVRQGQVKTLNHIVNFEDAIRRAMKEDDDVETL